MSTIYDVKILQRGQIVFGARIITANSAPEAVQNAMNNAAEMGIGDEPGETTTIEIIRHRERS